MANPDGLRHLGGEKAKVAGSGASRVEFKESKIPSVFFSPSNKQGHHYPPSLPPFLRLGESG